MKRTGVASPTAKSALMTQPSPVLFKRVYVLKKQGLTLMDALCAQVESLLCWTGQRWQVLRRY